MLRLRRTLTLRVSVLPKDEAEAETALAQYNPETDAGAHVYASG